MVSVLSSLPQQQQPLSHQNHQQDLHLQRPFVYDNGNTYELTMDTYQDQNQQQECYQQQLQEYEPISSPWTVEQEVGSPWFSPSLPRWQQEQLQQQGESLSPPPLMYADNDTDMKPVHLTSVSSSSCCSFTSYNDGLLTTGSSDEQSYPMADYFACRRDSSASASSGGSSYSENSTTSSISNSSYYEKSTATTAMALMTAKTEPAPSFVEPSPPSSTATATAMTTTSTSTRRSCSLRRHLSIRGNSSGGRPHQCGVCTRTFARRHDLERHTRVHTGIKPYVCPCCLKAFPRSDARGRHFRNEVRCRTGPQVLAFIKKNIRNTI